MNDNSAYIIGCGTNELLMQRLEFLFSKRMVFTCMRINTIEKLKESENGYYHKWLYIFIGHNNECKKVFNTATSGVKHGFMGTNPNANFTYISWDDFVRDALPTL